MTPAEAEAMAVRRAMGYDVPTLEVRDGIYRVAKGVEKAAAPIAAAAGYGAAVTKNPLLIKAAAFSSAIGAGAILVEEIVRPDLTQAIDQLNQLGMGIISPKPIRPFIGNIYDFATQQVGRQ